MNGHRLSAGVVLFLGLGAIAGRAAGAAAPVPSANDLAHCAAIVAADARLACYDALAPAASATPAAPARPPDTRTDAKAFGLPKPVPVAAPEVPELIHALVTQVTVGRLDGGSISVLLDNGQTWTVAASEVQLKAGDSVTIKRAALGSYLLTTQAKHSYRVRRLQ
jgi:hypothetical protein